MCVPLLLVYASHCLAALPSLPVCKLLATKNLTRAVPGAVAISWALQHRNGSLAHHTESVHVHHVLSCSNALSWVHGVSKHGKLYLSCLDVVPAADLHLTLLCASTHPGSTQATTTNNQVKTDLGAVVDIQLSKSTRLRLRITLDVASLVVLSTVAVNTHTIVHVGKAALGRGRIMNLTPVSISVRH